MINVSRETLGKGKPSLFYLLTLFETSGNNRASNQEEGKIMFLFIDRAIQITLASLIMVFGGAMTFQGENIFVAFIGVMALLISLGFCALLAEDDYFREEYPSSFGPS